MKVSPTASAQVKSSEQHSDENTGVAGGLRAERYPIQAEGSENNADEAGDQG